MNLHTLQKHWHEFGKRDPMWAILTVPEFAGNAWDPKEFFATGRSEINGVMARLRTAGVVVRTGRALDFGCGLGRLTQALACHFTKTEGVDIAPSMIEGAKQHNQYPDRCHYHLNARQDLQLFPSQQFDFVYSVIVLQHMQPRYSVNYLREFVRLLSPGGVAYFQIPSHLKSDPEPWKTPGPSPVDSTSESEERKPLLARLVDRFKFRAAPIDLEPVATPAMEMYGVYKSIVTEIVTSAGGRVLAITPDTWAGDPWESYTYTVLKQR